jgi:hypothetical protein
MSKSIELDKFSDGVRRGEVHVVSGPLPYLRIADAEGRYLGSVSDTRLRTLRDEITRALRRRPSTRGG